MLVTLGIRALTVSSNPLGPDGTRADAHGDTDCAVQPHPAVLEDQGCGDEDYEVREHDDREKPHLTRIRANVGSVYLEEVHNGASRGMQCLRLGAGKWCQG